MPTEISFSGGLTFRVSDSQGNVKFDINNRQPKVVARFSFAFTGANAVPDMVGTRKAYPRVENPYGNSPTTADQMIIVSQTKSAGYYTNIPPDNCFPIWHIMFPASQINELRVAGSSSDAIQTNATNRFLPYDDLGKWIPATGGQQIRSIFSHDHQGWVGGELFTYIWEDNPFYQVSGYQGVFYDNKYRIVFGVQRSIAGRNGGFDTGTDPDVNNGFMSTPYLYNMSSNKVIPTTAGHLTTATIKMTHYNFHVRCHICS